MKNNFVNTRIEYHIIQSFPVTCLNRDDVGSPKTAIVGGITRARVSSQCWKRQVRLALAQIAKYYPEIMIGIRTKKIGKLIYDKCLEEGASTLQAEKCSEAVEETFVKSSKKQKSSKTKNSKIDIEEETEDSKEEKSNDTLLFWSPKEIEKIALFFKENNFDETKFFEKDRVKKLLDILKHVEKNANALDIALFGRMVAKAADMNVEAACSFAHAISTHKVRNEIEFFTALDDLQDTQGSAHMGSLEFNSATYYRYISLDLGQLAQNLGEENLKSAITAFTKALFIAVPQARQSTQTGASPWEFARVLVRKGQRLQVPFETPVKISSEGGFLQNSVETLKRYLDTKEKLSGSMFGKIAGYDWGDNEHFSIDRLIEALELHTSVPATQRGHHESLHTAMV